MNVLRYTTDTRHDNQLAIARVAAAGRVMAERARERQLREQAWAVAHETGQLISDEDGHWCYICSRPTDHTGEHTPEQIAAWKAGR